MSSTSLSHKTIRPGSLSGYSYYYSNRRPPAVTRPAAKAARRRLPSLKVLAVPAILLALIGLPLLRNDTPPATQASQTQSTGNQPVPAAATAAAAISKPDANRCDGNTHGMLIKISISQRHLWACEGEKVVHNTPVITGMLTHPETLTPPGTYHVYAKTTNTTLTGKDSTGEWRRGVYYWMPFLDNEHGTYGFHDATWRPNSEFGQIDPATGQASHGCIELPLNSQKWLYEWAPIRTTVIVES